jgi:hypothetical protein
MSGPYDRADGRGRCVLIATVLLVAINACWSGKQYAVGPFSYGTDSTGLRTAIATTFEVTQTADAPIQIDGPATRTDAFGFLVWTCDASARQTQSLGLLALGDSVATLEPLIVADWRSNDFVVFTPGRAATLRVSTDGGFSGVPRSVPDTVHASQVIEPYCASKLDSLRSIPAARLNLTGGSVSPLSRVDVLLMKVYATRPRDVGDMRALVPTADELAFVAKQVARIATNEPKKARDMRAFLDEWQSRG